MAKATKVNRLDKKIVITLGENHYEVLKDKLSFSIHKRNGPGNMSPMGLYPSTFGRALEMILNDAVNKSSSEVQTIREYLNEVRSIYDQLRAVKAQWQDADNPVFDDGSLGIPKLPDPVSEEPECEPKEEEDDDEF